MKKLLALALGSFAIALSPALALAHGADTIEHISSFDSHVMLAADSSATIIETINYDFGSSTHHGLIREIPTTYQAGNGKDAYYLTFSGGSVTDENGDKVPVQQSAVTDGVSLKIGDANKTVTGDHVYKIAYSLAPIVLAGTDADHFLFDVTGNATAVLTEAASVTVEMASGLTITGQKCYTGAQGSTISDCSIFASGQTITASTVGNLGAHQGLTINVDLAPGKFSQYLVANKKVPINPWILVAFALYGVSVVGLIGWLVMGRVNEWRKRRAQTIIPEYEAPDGLKPGQLGMLIDNKTGMPEITATLIDLSVRGYMRIEHISKKSLLQPAKYKFTKLKEGTDLGGYEQRLFNELFASGSEVNLADLDQMHMSKVVSDVKKSIKDDLIAKGYYKKGKINWLWVGVVIILLLPAFFLSVFVAVFLIILLGSGSISMLSMTPEGFGEWAKVKGFKWFLSVTETDRLKFSDAPDKTPALFNKLLPAAVALGVEKEWAKQFESMDIAPSTGWYSSADPFTAGLLASSLSHDFGSAVSSGFAAPSSSGSSFSGGGGGGFSGGGFGGGGTGSW